ncbi:MAG: hypothetical protein GEU97_06395 [Actinophytocola sp.]|nr:hypothetical protein [Actinophytocola sp.]
MRERGGAHADRSDVVAERIATIADVLAEEFGPLAQALADRIASEIEQLGDDERLIQLLGASVAGNVETVLHMFQHGIDIDRVEVPSAAVEYARRLAQHGVAVDAMIRAYRLGQDSFLQRAFEELTGDDPALLAEVAQRLTAISFAYIDRVSQQVLTVYEDERERWLANRNAARAARIRELLDESHVDVLLAEETLGYRLQRQRHLGVVLWAVERGSPVSQISVLERYSRTLAEHLGCGARPLFVPTDEAEGWAWLPIHRDAPEPTADSLAPAARACGDDVNIAIGRPGRGVDGFRSTHQQARQAQAVAVIAGGEASLTLFRDVGPVALLCADLPATRVWVQDTLGPLAIDDGQHARLRETLRVFLAAGCSYLAAASALTLHKNTVQYRVRRAEQELGRGVRDDALSVELALRACHWFGGAVLRQP